MATRMTGEQFEALCDFLDSPEGCNFHERIPGDRASVTWKCDGTLAMTRQWLQEHGINVEVNIPQLERRGGHCDCEVLFNVVERWEDDLPIEERVEEAVFTMLKSLKNFQRGANQ